MRARGFSLLEVMVAVAILGLALTAILSAEAGLFGSGSRAQRESLAIGLARCKMGEIEERLLRLGYPEVDTTDEGACCEDSTPTGFTCSWKVQRVELPQPMNLDSNRGDAGAALSNIGQGLGTMPGSPGAVAAYGGGAPAGMPELPRGAGAIGVLIGAAANDGGVMSALGGADGGLGALSSMMGGATSTGVAGLAPLVMTIVYPSLKPMLEASIRKIVLTVEWRDGLRKRELSLVQYVTNPMRGGFTGMPLPSGMPSGFGPPGMLPPIGAPAAPPALTTPVSPFRGIMP